MTDNLKITIIVLACIVVLIFVLPHLQTEFFQSAPDDQSTSLLLIQEDKKLQDQYKYISVESFNAMIKTIQTIIYNDIVKFSKTCTDMNGYNEPGQERMSLQCYDDTIGIENVVITHICDYIIEHLKTKFKIRMNAYLIFSDFKVNFNLSEDILYPLSDSTLYTVHGVRYFTKTMLDTLISQNISIKNILYTILLRRGIDVIPDVDDHV